MSDSPKSVNTHSAIDSLMTRLLPFMRDEYFDYVKSLDSSGHARHRGPSMTMHYEDGRTSILWKCDGRTPFEKECEVCVAIVHEGFVTTIVDDGKWVLNTLGCASGGVACGGPSARMTQMIRPRLTDARLRPNIFTKDGGRISPFLDCTICNQWKHGCGHKDCREQLDQFCKLAFAFWGLRATLGDVLWHLCVFVADCV